MGMLCFLPWVTAQRPQTVGRFSLIPWKPGTAGPEVEAILRAYVDSSGRPVDSATLVTFTGHPLTADLDESERADIFDFGMMLAFAGLARRDVVPRWGSAGYANTDSFTLIIQAFREGEPGSVATVSRRRGGQVTTGYGRGLYQVRMAPHVEPLTAYRFGETLLNSLIDCFDSPTRLVYEEALFSFNAANTDSDQVPEQHEIVALVGAFERLLETSGKADELADSLMALLGEYLPPDRPQHLKRIHAFEKEHGSCKRGSSERILSGSITEAWVRDLYRVRNACGHGRRTYDKKSVWRMRGHLLLGAHLFPLAVLVRIAKEGFYALAEQDRSGLSAFPYLVSLREPLRWRLQRGSIWTTALNSAHEAEWRRRFLES